MDPPPLSGGPTSTTTVAPATGTMPQPPPPAAHLSYADSVDSPRSRNTDSWDEQHLPYGANARDARDGGGGKLRLMCSYGGHIFPRPHDKCLSYVGGDTRIFVADRVSSLVELSSKMSKTLLGGRSFCLKYQLPNEDLDSLISVTTDEDLENMIDEYDRLNSNNSVSNSRNSRLRLFIFPATNSNSAHSIGSLLENSTKSEDWFVHALNGANSLTKVGSESSSVNCLLGLDDDIGNGNGNENSTVKDAEAKNGGNNVKVSAQDVQSVPDSPMVETSSSFGSTNSTPSMANLPPIRVHVEENQRGGIEEQFAQMSVVVGGGRTELKQEEGGFVGLSSPPAPAAVATGTVVSVVPVGGEYASRVFSDDERSEQGIPVGYRRPAQPQQQQQQQLHQHLQWLQKPAVPSDLPSPDSVSSEGSVTNPLSRQRHFMYQEQGVQIQPGNSRVSANSVDLNMGEPNNRPQVQQQVQDSGYALPVHYDQQSQTHQPQQYVHAGQYFHHTPAGPVPMSYFPIYQSQQQTHPQHRELEHQYPVYFFPSRPAQAYNMPVQQTNYSESAPTAPPNRQQTPPPPTAAYEPARNPPASKPEMVASAYRAAPAAAPQMAQINSSQHQPQYVGYSQIHHPSQSIAPPSATAANYAYEFADPTHAQIYYTQPFTPQLAAQYQTVTSVPAGVLPETSSQPAENMTQQIRTSQP